MEQRENKLGSQPVGRLVIGMSLPLMISMFVQAMYNIVDGIYVAQLSEQALTATSLAFPAQMLMVAVAVGTGVGMSSLLSRRLGERKREEAGNVAKNGIFLAVMSYLLFLVFGLFFAEWYFRLFTKSEELIVLGVEYLVPVTTLSIGVFVAIMNERLLQATGKPTLSMLAQLSGAITNIILDPILIFGRCGMPEMGIKGAAVATVLGQVVGCCFALLCNIFANKDIDISFKGFRPDTEIIAGIYRVGVPAILMQALMSFCTILINKILIGFSEVSVAVYGIYFKLQSFVFMPVFGMTQGMVPIVGYNYGAKKGDRIIKATKIALVSGGAIMLAGTAIFHLFPEQLLALFRAGDEMMAIGVHALRILSCIFVIAGVSIIFTSVFQGLGLGTLSLINTLIRQFLVLLPGIYLIANYVGFSYVWYAFWISELLALVIALIMYAGVYRRHIYPITTAGKEAAEI